MFSSSINSLLTASLSNSCQMFSSSINNILGLCRDNSSIWMGNKRGKWSQSIGVGSVSIRISKNDLGISRPLLTAIDQSWDSGRMNIGSSLQWGPGGDTLGSVVLGSGRGNIGVKRGNSSIRVGHQLLGISRPFTIVNKRSSNSLSMCKVGIHNCSSFIESLKVLLGGCGIVGIKRSNSSIGVRHQLPTDSSKTNTNYTQYQILHN